MSFNRDDKIDEVEMAILRAIQDAGGFVNGETDKLITQIAEWVVDDPRSDWHDEEDEDDATDEELVCAACGDEIPIDGPTVHHVVTAHGRSFCSLECADTPREDWYTPEDDSDDSEEVQS